jgi:ribosomal protein S18 acetylase RimI-like enzyme
VALTALRSAAEVLVATGHHPYARGSLRRPLVSGWHSGEAVAWLGTDAEERRPYLSALGEPAAVAALLADLLPELPPRQRLTVPRGTPALLPAWVGLERPVDWDFRWRDAPPPVQPGEERVVEGAPDEAVAALLAEASPTASAEPGDPAVRRWWAVPGDDGLLACAADTSSATGVGHVSSVAVATAARGRGLGRAVAAAATRALLAEGCDVVTLGLYADNPAAVALYDALGFDGPHRFTSGRLVQRTRW